MANRKRAALDEENTEEDDLQAKSRKETLHLENQERAYVAASRRTDRSLEARYQSALMASKVHEKRTGKSFHVTHEIVANEDMYEEQDNGLPPLEPSSAEAAAKRIKSQADAYVAALIARKCGMVQDFQWEQTTPTLLDPNNAFWQPSAGAYPYAPSQQNGLDNELLAPQMGFSTNSGAEDDYWTNVEGETSAAAWSTDWSPNRPSPWTVHRSSNDSSLTDFLADFSSFSDQHDPHGFNVDSGKPSLHLEECLADVNGEGFQTRSHNGLPAEYSTK